MRKSGVCAVFLCVFVVAGMMCAAVSGAGENRTAKLTADQLADIAAQPDLMSKLAAQPDITVSHDAQAIKDEEGGGYWVHAEVAIPVPDEMGGGYLVGTQEALKAALSAVEEGEKEATLALTIKIAGTGGGSVTSTPAGVLCRTGTCTASFDSTKVKKVVLHPAIASDGSSRFTGWSGGSCTGTKACTINNISGTSTITATFTSLAHIGFSPKSLSFGNVAVGKTKKLVLTVVSSGRDYLKISSIALVGTGVSQFNKTGDSCPKAPKQKMDILDQCNVAVTFAPTRTGTFSAAIRILTNDAKNATVTIPLTGVGVSR